MSSSRSISTTPTAGNSSLAGLEDNGLIGLKLRNPRFFCFLNRNNHVNKLKTQNQKGFRSIYCDYSKMNTKRVKGKILIYYYIILRYSSFSRRTRLLIPDMKNPRSVSKLFMLSLIIVHRLTCCFALYQRKADANYLTIGAKPCKEFRSGNESH